MPWNCFALREKTSLGEPFDICMKEVYFHIESGVKLIRPELPR